MIPPPGRVHSEDDDDGRNPPYRDGRRGVKILWAGLLVVVLIAVL